MTIATSPLWNVSVLVNGGVLVPLNITAPLPVCLQAMSKTLADIAGEIHPSDTVEIRMRPL